MRQTVSLKKQYQIVDDLLVQRIHKLLPELMEETGYDMWIILCREYNEDPVFTTMLPSLCLTARRLSCLVFVKQGERFEALNFGRPSEHLNRVYTQGYTDSSRDQLEMLAEYVRKVEPQRIGINCSPINAMCFPNRCMINCIRRSTHRTAISCAAPTRWRCAGLKQGRRRSFPATAPFTSWQWRFARKPFPERSSRPV